MGSIDVCPVISVKQHRIVCLDAYLCPVPKFSIPHTYQEYHNTSSDEVIDRVKDATIIITTRVSISAATIAACSPELELITVMGIGFDTIDVAACRARQIAVCNSPAASGESVAEHAIALYFAAKRRIVDMHAVVRKGEEWPMHKSAFHLYPRMPVVCRKEVMAIVGYGALGKLIEGIAKALGMRVLIADRKGISTPEIRPGRTAFEQALSSCSVLVIACPLDNTSRNMITEKEIRLLQPHATLINVARGGVIDEHALVKALKESWIAAAATDVFAIEPATATSSPLTVEDVPNLTLSPHIAWYADSSLERLQEIVKTNIEGFVSGNPEHLVTGSFVPIMTKSPVGAKPLRIAVFVNTDEAPYRTMMEEGYSTIFANIAPTAIIEFFDPIVAQNYPSDLSAYDLLVVGGGTYIVDESLPWYLKEIQFLRSLPQDFPQLKVVAICFGHQKIAEIFGGKMTYMDRPEVRLHTFPQDDKFY
jgi:lactate dehydrogenase-like 2-hydroxyacid dehydrogenase